MITTGYYPSLDFRSASSSTQVSGLTQAWPTTAGATSNGDADPATPSDCQSGLIAGALQTLQETSNREVADKARDILLTIQEAIEMLEAPRHDLDYLPRLYADNVEDGSVLLEWIFPDFRIGFSVEPDPEESSWQLASGERLGTIAAFGYTRGINLRKLVWWLLGFVIPNS